VPTSHSEHERELDALVFPTLYSVSSRPLAWFLSALYSGLGCVVGFEDEALRNVYIDFFPRFLCFLRVPSIVVVVLSISF